MFDIGSILTNKVFVMFCLAVTTAIAALIIIICIYCMCQRNKKRRFMQRAEKERYLNNALENDIDVTYHQCDTEDYRMYGCRDGVWLSIQSDSRCFREKADIRIPVIIGRGSDCDITCSDSSVSGKHCQIFLVDDNMYVRDMGSKNHTIVEDEYGRKVLGKNQRAEIFFNSVIRLGNTTVTLSNLY